MTKNELQNELSGLKIGLGRIDNRIDSLENRMNDRFSVLRDELRKCATKDDLRGFSTKNDLKGFATRDDLKGFATKDDLKGFATRDDLKGFATKGDLNRFATKDDLGGYATKNDLIQLREQLKSYAGVQFEELKHLMQIVIEGFSGHTDSLGFHEKRISHLEDEIPLLKAGLKLSL